MVLRGRKSQLAALPSEKVTTSKEGMRRTNGADNKVFFDYLKRRHSKKKGQCKEKERQIKKKEEI